MPTTGEALKFFSRGGGSGNGNLRGGQKKPFVRVAVLGQASVGKTVLITRYISRVFIEEYAPEISKIHAHRVAVDKETNVDVEIWDTAGHFQSHAEIRHLEVFVRWADVVVLVYSISDRASFNLALQLLDQIDRLKPQRDESLVSRYKVFYYVPLRDLYIRSGEQQRSAAWR